jgi:hypothetical protein
MRLSTSRNDTSRNDYSQSDSGVGLGVDPASAKEQSGVIADVHERHIHHPTDVAVSMKDRRSPPMQSL